jgi:hypothetical protein
VSGHACWKSSAARVNGPGPTIHDTRGAGDRSWPSGLPNGGLPSPARIRRWVGDLAHSTRSGRAETLGSNGSRIGGLPARRAAAEPTDPNQAHGRCSRLSDAGDDPKSKFSSHWFAWVRNMGLARVSQSAAGTGSGRDHRVASSLKTRNTRQSRHETRNTRHETPCRFLPAAHFQRSRPPRASMISWSEHLCVLVSRVSCLDCLALRGLGPKEDRGAGRTGSVEVRGGLKPATGGSNGEPGWRAVGRGSLGTPRDQAIIWPVQKSRAYPAVQPPSTVRMWPFM